MKAEQKLAKKQLLDYIADSDKIEGLEKFAGLDSGGKG